MRLLESWCHSRQAPTYGALRSRILRVRALLALESSLGLLHWRHVRRLALRGSEARHFAPFVVLAARFSYQACLVVLATPGSGVRIEANNQGRLRFRAQPEGKPPGDLGLAEARPCLKGDVAGARFSGAGRKAEGQKSGPGLSVPGGTEPTWPKHASWLDLRLKVRRQITLRALDSQTPRPSIRLS